MLKIGDFSKLSRVSVRMLRYYDEVGLLSPEETDRFTNYRYYSERQLLLAGRINHLRSMGFSVAQTREILRTYPDPEPLKQYLDLRREELNGEIRRAAEKLRLLDTAEQWLRKDSKSMNYTVTVKTIPERTVASLRTVLPSYADVGIAWGMLCEETARMDLIPDDPCLCSAIYHDSEYRETDVDVEIQKTVRGTYPDTEHVRFKTEPAVTVASAIHNGSYAGLDDAMRAVAQWVQDTGHEFSGAAFCIYHVSPHETDDPDRSVTEICYPVRG